MNPLTRALARQCCVIFCGLALAPVLSSAGILDYLLPRNDLEAITVTDMTPAGSLRRSPTPQQPVYFLAISNGYMDLGGIKAGERPVSREVVDKTVLLALAKQGYLPATTEHEPEIALVWVWGTLNAKASPLNIGSTPLNHGQLVRFLGGEKLGFASRQNDFFPELSLPMGLLPGGDLGRLLDVAKDDLYIAVICAFDLEMSPTKEPVMLWHTRISSPARGFWLPDALPAMLAIASPYIGRETTKPVWVQATEKFRPDIQLGDPKLVEYIERNDPPVIQNGPSR